MLWPVSRNSLGKEFHSLGLSTGSAQPEGHMRSDGTTAQQADDQWQSVHDVSVPSRRQEHNRQLDPRCRGKRQWRKTSIPTGSWVAQISGVCGQPVELRTRSGASQRRYKLTRLLSSLYLQLVTLVDNAVYLVSQSVSFSLQHLQLCVGVLQLLRLIQQSLLKLSQLLTQLKHLTNRTNTHLISNDTWRPIPPQIWKEWPLYHTKYGRGDPHTTPNRGGVTPACCQLTFWRPLLLYSVNYYVAVAALL